MRARESVERRLGGKARPVLEKPEPHGANEDVTRLAATDDRQDISRLQTDALVPIAPGRVQGVQALPRASTAASTSSACPGTLTLRQTLAI